MLTVVCTLWTGWRPLYGPHNVNALRLMLRDHLRVPHRLVCVTDQPHGIDPSIEILPMWKAPDVTTKPGWPNCYRRLNLFRRDIAQELGPRILSIDLDCVIARDITPLITDHDFRICKGMMAPYNGSMWMITAGSRPQVWEEFDPEKSPAEAFAQRTPNGRRYLGSDQAWISHLLPGEATWGEDDGVHLFRGEYSKKRAPQDPRIVFFPGHRKPWDELIRDKIGGLYETYQQYLLEAGHGTRDRGKACLP